jgi:hypothetical protein
VHSPQFHSQQGPPPSLASLVKKTRHFAVFDGIGSTPFTQLAFIGKKIEEGQKGSERGSFYSCVSWDGGREPIAATAKSMAFLYSLVS